MVNADKNIKKSLKKIADKIKNGANPEDFKDEIDKLLESSLSKINRELDKNWEDSYRKNGFN